MEWEQEVAQPPKRHNDAGRVLTRVSGWIQAFCHTFTDAVERHGHVVRNTNILRGFAAICLAVIGIGIGGHWYPAVLQERVSEKILSSIVMQGELGSHIHTIP
jgi:hypothetical protein